MEQMSTIEEEPCDSKRSDLNCINIAEYTRTKLKFWCDVHAESVCVCGQADTLPLPKSEDKFLHISVQTFEFFSFVHSSLHGHFFPFVFSLLCTSCYLMCVACHFARYRLYCVRSCNDSLPAVNAFAVSRFPFFACSCGVFGTSHLILAYQFWFHMWFTCGPNTSENQTKTRI